MYHRPVCAECEVEMVPETNGVGVLDMAEFGPHQVWDADLYKCPKCGFEVIVGFGQAPLAEHHEGNFESTVQSYRDRECLYRSNQ